MALLWCALLVLCVKYLDCHQTTYRTSNNLTCFLCEPGTFLVQDCQVDYQNAVCKPCTEGTYTPIHTQARYCQPCSVTCRNSNYESLYNQREIITSNCTSTSDIVCECRPGFWRESGDRGICRPARECGQGHGVTTQSTGHSDTFCEPCKAGETFSNTTSAYDPCWPCTQCDGHMSVGRACEADGDTECIPLSTTADRAAGIKNHRTTFLGAAYVELSRIFPAKEFKMYFRQLGIDECTIQRIETEHHGNVREQCYQLLMVWERMRTNKTKLSQIEWSLELIRKLKYHIDERLKAMPDGLKQQCHSILDEHSLEMAEKLPRLNS